MKRVVYILIGVLTFATISFVVGSIATNWYASTLAKSDDDINSSVLIFLILWPVIAALGGWLGAFVFRRFKSLS